MHLRSCSVGGSFPRLCCRLSKPKGRTDGIRTDQAGLRSVSHLHRRRAFVWVAFSASADDQVRVALVLGNSEYEHVSKLPNPARDAQDIGAAFERIGFTVTTGFNLATTTKCALCCGTLQRMRRMPMWSSSTSPATASRSTTPTTSSRERPIEERPGRRLRGDPP